MRSLLLPIIVTIFLAGCEPEWEDPYETFVLPKGKHATGTKLQFLQANELSFYVIFDESAIYNSTVPENQWDINKLVGFADCNSHHHTNSARFGWRWLNDSLEIHAYCYVDSERISEKIGTLELNTPGYFNIKLTDTTYRFTFNGHPTVEIPRHKTCDRGEYYMLWPYFGGDEVAPHDITIKVRMSY